MSYEIKTFDDAYLEKQVEIGESRLKDWPGTAQTPVEQLKRRYAMDDFDPELKLYAFKDNEMVGFMTATIKKQKEGEDIIRANMEFPIVKDGFEEASNLLFDKAIETLRSKGVKRVQSRASVEWGSTMDLVKQYGYSLKRVLGSSASVDLGTFKSPSSDLQVQNFEESDLDATRTMYKEQGILDHDRFDAQYKFIQENPERIVSWHIVKDGDRVIGNSILTTPGADSKEVSMTNIIALGDTKDEVRRAILGKNIDTAKEKGYQKLNLFLFGQFLDYKKYYQELGFSFNPDLSLFHKDI
ncbi:MAG: hypothetical protein INQ03_18240 [Candidatus Heimdallarchaeota archaeon]|nr:hypothetical protein [Candidatus Heimdallarchaeota archaeon]